MRQKGFGLIDTLIACAAMLVLLSVVGPATVRISQTSNANAAAQQLAQINAAEFAAAQLYGAYFAPANLTGGLAAGVSCSNPLLIPASLATAPDHYSLTFHGSGSGKACAGVSTYSSYTLSMTATDKLGASRSFITDSTQVIRAREGAAAQITDPIFTISAPSLGSVATVIQVTAVNGNNGGNNNNNGGGGGGLYNGGVGTFALSPNTYYYANPLSSGSISGAGQFETFPAPAAASVTTLTVTANTSISNLTIGFFDTNSSNPTIQCIFGSTPTTSCTGSVAAGAFPINANDGLAMNFNGTSGASVGFTWTIN